MQADGLGEKIKLWQMENFGLILEVSKLMTINHARRKDLLPAGKRGESGQITDSAEIWSPTWEDQTSSDWVNGWVTVDIKTNQPTNQLYQISALMTSDVGSFSFLLAFSVSAGTELFKQLKSLMNRFSRLAINVIYILLAQGGLQLKLVAG